MSEKPGFDDSVMGKAYDSRLIKRLFQYLYPYRSYVYLSFFVLLFSTAAELLSQAYIYKVIIDYYIAEQDTQGLAWMACFYLILCVVMFIGQSIQFNLVNTMSQRSMRDLRLHLFRHLEGMSLSFFNKRPVGSLMTRITSDIEALDSMFANCIVYTFSDILVIVGLFGFMLYLSPELTLIMMLVFPLILLITFRFKNGVRKAYRNVRRILAQLNGYLQENISGMNTIQIFGKEKRHFHRYARLTSDFQKANVDTVFYFALYFPAVEFISMLAIATLLWYGGGKILAEQSSLTFGTLVFFLKASTMFFQPIRDLADKFNILQTAMASAERIFALMDTHEKIEPAAKPVQKTIQGEIEFRNVWFAYRDEDWVLKDISFRAPAGNRVAIVGATGSGKSTIINLVYRFYDVQHGEILIDGVNVKDYDLKTLRSQMGLVLQDLFLFSGDIAGNIGLQRDDVPREKIVEAARVVQAHPFIEKMPDQYDAEVKERGATLSNGQRQLLSFARALAINPKVLILDEATSSVDTETEYLIQQALDRLLTGRTCLMIAHRLSTVQQADEILVLHHGEIMERGNHQELLDLQGMYYRLYLMQYKDQAAVSDEDETEAMAS